MQYLTKVHPVRSKSEHVTVYHHQLFTFFLRLSRISSQSSLLDPLDHSHWSFFSNQQLTPVSRSQITPNGMPHLTCATSKLPSTVRVPYQFDPSSSPSSSPSSCTHAPMLDCLLTSLVAFSILVLKLSCSFFFPSIAVYPFLRLISWNYDHSLFGSHWRCSIGKCSRLNQHSWLSVHTVI